ncbi:group II intron maturase-specific domain-containing protein [Dolichospermum sp. UHCC 0315A]|uniref:group II intron maturase-specific domain-containing protein n=1 Tax=Dolichospermum sp. UHCC 0315A TaxID=1914871 RepID=UPI00352E502F
MNFYIFELLYNSSRLCSQAELIKDLNPIIRASYYRVSDAGTTGDFSRLDRITYLRLRR